MKDIGAGSPVWAQRCQAWAGTSQRPTHHMSMDCFCKSGRGAAEGSTVCPWQAHLEWGQMAPLSGHSVPTHSILHHRALSRSQVNALTVILSMAPERTSLTVPKVGAIFPWTLETFIYRHNEAQDWGGGPCFPCLRIALSIVFEDSLTSGRESKLSFRAFRIAQRR